MVELVLTVNVVRVLEWLAVLNVVRILEWLAVLNVAGVGTVYDGSHINSSRSC